HVTGVQTCALPISPDVRVTCHAACGEGAAGHRNEQGAAWFMDMLTVPEATVAEEGRELDKAFQQVRMADVGQADLAYAGGVDQVPACGEVEQPGGGKIGRAHV